jgi:MoxR-like ATPase
MIQTQENLSEEIDLDLVRKNGRKILKWKTALEQVGYLAPFEMLFEFVLWWELRDGPWILEGKPGTGKTSFVIAVSKVLNERIHRLDCFPEIGRDESLYSWNTFLQKITAEHYGRSKYEKGEAFNSQETARAIYNYNHMFFRPLSSVILSQSNHPIGLINELDKVPLKSDFHSVILQVIDEFEITIPEMNTVLSRGDKPRPHIFITSNAGDKDSSRSGGEEMLPDTILRRGPRYKIVEHSMAKRFDILLKKAPRLPRSVVIDSIYYLESIRNQNLEKEISLSEIIKWIQRLEYLDVGKLTPQVVRATIRSLTKTDFDTKSLSDNLTTTFGQVIPRLKERVNVEAELTREKQYEESLIKYIERIAED